MKHGRRFWIGSLVVVVLAVGLALLAAGEEAALAQAKIIYVDADATGANDGVSWADAFLELQDAFDAAVAGDRIWVAAGTYRPTAQHGGSGDRYRSFQMKNGVAIYGGFDPTVGDIAWRQRDSVGNVTILSGDIGAAGNSSDNSYHVFYHPAGTNLDDSATLDGFTITDGNADSPDAGDHRHGGGMYNDESSPTLANCAFEGNTATFNGGGIYNAFSSPALTDCTFEGNSASAGGAVYNLDLSPELTDCIFRKNTANAGGGIWNDGSSPTLTRCTFEDNRAEFGGAMYNSSSSAVLTDCTFDSNIADVDGGGMYNATSSPTLDQCRLLGNRADRRGGGMANASSSPEEPSSPKLSNCTFSDNHATDWGGGMYNAHSLPELINSQFLFNWAGEAGGGMFNYDSSPILTECSFSGNWTVEGGGGGMYNMSASFPELTECYFEGNSASHGGGMHNAEGASPFLADCTFSGNNAHYGGGMSNDESSCMLVNSTFLLNAADYWGGAMYNHSSSPVLTNCTFWGNLANSGGGLYNSSSSPALTNCILWEDSKPEIVDYNSSPVVAYSDVQLGYPGTNNIDDDPAFVDAVDGDFHLTPDSPCIDAGDNFAPNLPFHDFEGDARVLDGDGNYFAFADMGVDEFVYWHSLVVDIDVTPDISSNVINLRTPREVPVAILTIDEFDVAAVAADTVVFAGATHVGFEFRDVDADDDIDLVLLFETEDMVDLDEDSTEANLTGYTLGGMPFAGTARVKVKE